MSRLGAVFDLQNRVRLLGLMVVAMKVFSGANFLAAGFGLAGCVCCGVTLDVGGVVGIVG